MGHDLGGDIDCRNGQFNSAGNGDTTALRFTRMDAAGNIYLSAGFEAKGKVQLNAIIVRGNIDCRGGTFTVPPSAGHDAAAHDAAAPSEAFSEDAVSLVNAKAGGALIIAPIDGKGEPAAVFNGSLDLKSAHIQVLVDSPEAWPKQASAKGLRNVIHLDGFTYDRFGGNAPTGADTRIKWLQRQPPAHLGRDFKPQPFEQLIKVLQSMGHPEEARRVAMCRQEFLLGRPFRWKAVRGLWNVLDAAHFLIAKLILAVFGVVLGHGYRPARLFWAMAIVGVTCGYYYKIAAQQGIFAPRDSQVFLAEDFASCRPDKWISCEALTSKFTEYPKFNPWVYSFNVLLPVVDLHQEKSWVPMQKEVWLRHGEEYVFVMLPNATHWIVIAEIVFGWIASLLLVATFSGLVKTE